MIELKRIFIYFHLGLSGLFSLFHLLFILTFSIPKHRTRRYISVHVYSVFFSEYFGYMICVRDFQE